MSLDQAIKHGKEKRKPYRRSKRFDRTCRNHGGCPYCERNRTFGTQKLRALVELNCDGNVDQNANRSDADKGR